MRVHLENLSTPRAVMWSHLQRPFALQGNTYSHVPGIKTGMFLGVIIQPITYTVFWNPPPGMGPKKWPNRAGFMRFRQRNKSVRNWQDKET